jgi:hypothetical protein
MCGQCTHENDHFMKYATFIKPVSGTGGKKQKKRRSPNCTSTGVSDARSGFDHPVASFPYKYSLMAYFRDLSPFPSSVLVQTSKPVFLVFISIFTSKDYSSCFLQLVKSWNDQDKSSTLDRYFIFRIFALVENNGKEKERVGIKWDGVHSFLLNTLYSGSDDRTDSWFNSFSLNNSKWKESLLEEERRIKIILFADDWSVIKSLTSYRTAVLSHLIDYRMICISNSFDVSAEDDFSEGSVFVLSDEEEAITDEDMQFVAEFINS